MAETKQLLERAKRAFDPPTDVMDALVARRDRKRRNQRVQAGALGIAIAIGLGWLGVVAIRSTPLPADEPLPSTPESWSRVQLDPSLAGGEAPGFLVAGPDRLAAVGVHGGPATAWTSSDGAIWTRSPAEDLDRADLEDIRSGGPGFLATGRTGPDGSHGEPWILTSEDGVSWNRLPDDPVFGDTLFISAVAPGGPGLVAVGSWMGAWYSSDGMTWERASVPPVPPEVYPGDDGKTPQIYLTDVADQGGRLVATGWAMLNDNSEVIVVWTSRDGRSWTDVPTKADVFPPGSSISEITAGPEGFVAVGHLADGQESTAAIWSSPDGRDWRLHRPGPEGLQLSSVAAGDGGYVAVGATMECNTDCASREAVVMTSVDGETWVRVPSGPDFRVAQPSDPENAQGAAMYDVVAWGSRFAALGEYDGEPTVWVTTPGIQEDVPTPTPPEPAPVVSSALAYGVDGDVFLADADGSNAVKIADGVPLDLVEECAPGEERAHYIALGTAWSPDGRYLAYWDRGCPWQVRDDPEDAWGIVRITDTGGNLVASFPGQGWTISWSPDSTRVAVMDVWAPEGQGDATIGVYGLDGVRQVALTLPSALTPGGDYSPAWSRDGSSILFHGVRVPLDGDAPTPLSHGFDEYSPDGSRFANVEDGSLVVGDNNTPDARRAADPGEFWDLAWSPNGDLVAFEVDGTKLLVRDVATGADTSLLDVTRSERLHVIEFSPDGDRILFTRSDADYSRSSLWSIGADGSDLRRLVDAIDWADLRPQGRGEQA
jgi:Tol biopolymer transport system component